MTKAKFDELLETLFVKRHEAIERYIIERDNDTLQDRPYVIPDYLISFMERYIASSDGMKKINRKITFTEEEHDEMESWLCGN